MGQFLPKKRRSKIFERDFKISMFKTFREIKETRDYIKNKDLMRSKTLRYFKRNQMEISEMQIVIEKFLKIQ